MQSKSSVTKTVKVQCWSYVSCWCWSEFECTLASNHMMKLFSAHRIIRQWITISWESPRKSSIMQHLNAILPTPWTQCVQRGNENMKANETQVFPWQSISVYKPWKTIAWSHVVICYKNLTETCCLRNYWYHLSQLCYWITVIFFWGPARLCTSV